MLPLEFLPGRSLRALHRRLWFLLYYKQTDKFHGSMRMLEEAALDIDLIEAEPSKDLYRLLRE